MSTSVNTAFINAYNARVHQIFQRMGGFLRPAVMTEDNVVGNTYVFQKIGKGVATTKSRHGTVTTMNNTHTAPSATLVDFYAADYYDKLDQAKTNIGLRDAIATSGAWALGRKVDDQILTVLDGTSQSTVSWVVSTEAAIRNSLIGMCEALDSLDVPNDGQRYAVLTPKAWAFAQTVEEFSSADFVGSDGLPFNEGAPQVGKWKSWNGVMWMQHSGCPGKGTATAKVFAWHRNSTGYATGAHAGNIAANQGVAADIDWVGERQAWLVTHCMSGGGVLIDDTGVIEGNLDDTASLPTS